MPDPTTPESSSPAESEESFGRVLSEFEQSHSGKARGDAGSQREGTVIAVSSESVYVDIGLKSEGVLPLAAFQNTGEAIKPGDKLVVSVKGRDPEGYYQLSRFRVERPADWSSLERAFADKRTIVGTVTGVVKGGLSVDVGVRAFMPASRSGTSDSVEMEKLVGQEIHCRIIKLDVADEDVVVDRRAVAEAEERLVKERRLSEIKEGETITGIIRSLTDYGAFVDLGGVDGLLHVSDIAWSRINKPADVLASGQQVEVKILKVDAGKQRISLGMKQLQPHPWDAAAEKYRAGDRVRGRVTRVVEFGVFVELEPGIEGLIHLSEMSWARKVRKPGDVVKPGETVEAVILGVNAGERRISLGLKQALGDPWADVPERFAVGSVIEGSVVNLTRFGAFVQLAEGVEGMIHVSDISAEKRINHPQDVLKVGQPLKAQVLAIDKEKRQLRLGIRQMAPSDLDEYIAEHKEGDVVTGRLTEISGNHGHVELGEGIQATCRISAGAPAEEELRAESKADISSLSSMLKARWKGGASAGGARQESMRAGQICRFRIYRLDPEAKKIELVLA